MSSKINVTLLFLPPLIMLMYTLVTLTVNVPYLEDTRVILGHVTDHTNSGISRYFDFNNEHWLVTTRIVAELCYLIFKCINFKILCVLGSLFLIAWVFILSGNIFKTIFKMLIASAFAYMSFSFLNFENLCWATASLSNYQVLFWGLCANVLIEKTHSIFSFVFALLSAFLATVSNSGGLAIWPCLILQFVYLKLINRNQTTISFISKLFALSVAAATTITIYLSLAPKHEIEINFTILPKMILAGVTFCGGYIPFPALSVTIGILTVIGIILILIQWNRIKSSYILFHLIYLLGIAFGASLNRTNDIIGSFHSRYAIFAIGITFCTLFLILETCNTKIKAGLLYSISTIILTLAIGLSMTTLYIGVPQYRTRNEIMRKNILLWPESTVGIRCWNHEYTEYDTILHMCLKKNVYNPVSNLYHGEQRPHKITPWLK